MLIDEDDEDVEKELFEPVYFDHLDTSIVLKKALAAELSGESEELENFKKDLELKGKTPNGEFGAIQWQTIDAKKKLILTQMGGTPEAPGLVQDPASLSICRLMKRALPRWRKFVLRWQS